MCTRLSEMCAYAMVPAKLFPLLDAPNPYHAPRLHNSPARMIVAGRSQSSSPTSLIVQGLEHQPSHVCVYACVVMFREHRLLARDQCADHIFDADRPAAAQHVEAVRVFNQLRASPARYIWAHGTEPVRRQLLPHASRVVKVSPLHLQGDDARIKLQPSFRPVRTNNRPTQLHVKSSRDGVAAKQIDARIADHHPVRPRRRRPTSPAKLLLTVSHRSPRLPA